VNASGIASRFQFPIPVTSKQLVLEANNADSNSEASMSTSKRSLKDSEAGRQSFALAPVEIDRKCGL
jgi:hypothetical protein